MSQPFTSKRLAGRVGAYVKGKIRDSITALKEPPNAPETVRRKGSSDPLLDTGTLRNSVDWEVER